MRILLVSIVIIALVVVGWYATKSSICRASLTSEQVNRLHNNYTKEELNYFSKIAFGNDLGTLSPTIHKWNKKIVNVKIITSCTKKEYQEVNKVLNDLNSISQYTKFILGKQTPDLSIYFMPRQDIKKLFHGHSGDANGTFGFSTTMCGEITSAKVAVGNNLSFAGWEEAIIREEITQSIGLPIDTDEYTKSVFSSNKQIIINDVSENTYALFATEYLAIDKKIISILYNSGLQINTTLDDFKNQVL